MTKYNVYVAMLINLLVSLVLVIQPPKSAAQEYPGLMIFRGGDANSLSWSSDSRKFAMFGSFSRSLLELPSPHWIAYDVPSAVVTTNNTWPLQPFLTVEEKQFFAPSEWSGNRKSYIYRSPDNQFIVYASGAEEIEVPNLTIGKVNSLQRLDISYLYFPFTGPDDFDVRWSEDSSAFVVLTQPPYGEGYTIKYFNDFQDNLTSISQGVFLHDLQINDTNYLGREFFDLSSGGDVVLIRAGEETESGSFSQIEKLVLYNVANPNSSNVLNLDAKTIRTACFAHNDENNIFVINELGLVQYNIANQTSTMLSTAIRFDNTLQALCSPDGQYLAYVIGELDSDKSVYVLKISDLMVTSSVTSFTLVNADTNTEWSTTSPHHNRESNRRIGHLD